LCFQRRSLQTGTQESFRLASPCYPKPQKGYQVG